MTDAARANLGEQHPVAYKQLLGLSARADQDAVDAGLERGFIDLIKLRTSQINGCAFCLRAHTRDAIEHGESTERIALLPAWRESGYFTDQERAALTLAESITEVAHTHVDDADYAPAQAALTAAQVSAVAWVTTVMNALNRVSITSRYVVAPE